MNDVDFFWVCVLLPRTPRLARWFLPEFVTRRRLLSRSALHPSAVPTRSHVSEQLDSGYLTERVAAPCRRDNTPSQAPPVPDAFHLALYIPPHTRKALASSDNMTSTSTPADTSPKDGNVNPNEPPRSGRACLACRKLKTKCEGAENPPCKRCLAGGHDCEFVESRRGKRSVPFVCCLLREG